MIRDIAIINYPRSLQSAVYGLEEMFEMASAICLEQGLDYQFRCHKHSVNSLAESKKNYYDAIILPPSNASDFYLQPPELLLNALRHHHANGTIIASACAGTFIVAATNLLNHKPATTHWGLANTFAQQFSAVDLTIDKILVNDIDLITAGGMMSWLDLGLELVTIFTQSSVMRQLGKRLVVDTGTREQRFYQQFSPILNHGDLIILTAQRHLQSTYTQTVTIADFAKQHNLSERTFLRRFVKATQLKPNQYLQKLRIQKACDLLETSQSSFESIAHQVGYEDVSGCRKLFVRTMGLTPSAFRQRFQS